MSLQAIEESAWRFRQAIGATREPWLEVERILEHALSLIFGEEAHFEVRSMAEMGSNHALADPDTKYMLIREDVYQGVCSHKPRDRMTIIHEIAHFILHGRMRLARRMSGAPPPPYRDPEWQAKAFAGAVMVPRSMVPDPWNVDAAFLAREFGVSLPAAQIRLDQLKRLAMPKQYERPGVAAPNRSQGTTG
jgi:Zn-dependent peptidase ImmA (M78 family)